MLRFPCAETVDEAVEYYKNRAIEFLKFGWSWNGEYKVYSWGIEIELISPDNKPYSSVYVLEKGRGHLSRWFEENKDKKFVTSDDCHAMHKYLIKKGRPHRVIDTWFSSEYYAIRSYYGSDRAKRSNLPYMSHIDEGIYLLQQLDSRPCVLNAFALHPLYQGDKDFKRQKNWNYNGRAIALAMEYRHVANNHLSFHDPKVPVLSPLKKVNKMLIADKIQNCKDFELYLEGRDDVPNSDRLREYFHREWFPALKITETYYAEQVTKLCRSSGISIAIDWKDGLASPRLSTK